MRLVSNDYFHSGCQFHARVCRDLTFDVSNASWQHEETSCPAVLETIVSEVACLYEIRDASFLLALLLYYKSVWIAIDRRGFILHGV